jgi:hypothetical protein
MEAGKSGRGLPQSKTWRKFQRAGEREASWTAPALWRFGTRQCQFRMPPGQLAAPQSDGRAGARVSPPAAASPDLTARDFLDADWTVHALRLGGARVVPTRSAWQAVGAGNLGAFMPAFLLLTRADCNDRMLKIQS